MNLRSFANLPVEYVSIGMRVCQAGLAFLLGVILARSLSVEGFGLFTEVQAWIMLAVTLIHSGFSALLVREVARARQLDALPSAKGLIRYALIGTTLCALITSVFIILAVLSGRIEDSRSALFVIALPIVLLNSLTFTLEAALRGLGRNLLGQVAQLVVRPLVQILVLVTLITAFGLTADGAMLALLVAVALTCGFALVAYVRAAGFLKPLHAQYSMSEWNPATAALALVGLLAAVSAQVGFIVLGALDGPEAVADFRVAVNLSTLALFGYAAVLAKTGPQFAALIAAEDTSALKSAAQHAARTSALFSLPLLVIYLIFGGDLLALHFSEQYRDAALVLAALCLHVAFTAVAGLAVSILIAARQVRVVTLWQFAGQAVHVALLFALIPRMGALGAALALAGSSLVTNGALTLVVLRRFGFFALPLTAR